MPQYIGPLSIMLRTLPIVPECHKFISPGRSHAPDSHVQHADQATDFKTWSAGLERAVDLEELTTHHEKISAAFTRQTELITPLDNMLDELSFILL